MKLPGSLFGALFGSGSSKQAPVRTSGTLLNAKPANVVHAVQLEINFVFDVDEANQQLAEGCRCCKRFVQTNPTAIFRELTTFNRHNVPGLILSP